MKNKRGIILALIVIVLLLAILHLYSKYKTINIPRDGGQQVIASSTLPFKVPAGFEMSVFADNVRGARVLAFDPVGNIIVSETSEGKVVALPDTNNDHKADSAVTIIEGLNNPHGLEFRCTDTSNPTKCTLYVAEEDKLVSYEYDAINLKALNPQKLLNLPGGAGSHFTRTLLFLPSPEENILLISVGSSCNVCMESDNRRAKILFYNTLTKETGEYATGLRNSVFMALHPVTGEVWATEMGRDGLGDDIPPDEINIIRKGSWYGWPWFYGKNIEDMKFSPNARPSFTFPPIQSHVDLQAHSAPLGLGFVPEEGWPEEYWFNLLVAYHGSWNRSVPTGYKVVLVRINARGDAGKTEDFITGFLTPDGKKIGRPVDIKVLSGGTMYITDDYAGTIYRVFRK